MFEIEYNAKTSTNKKKIKDTNKINTIRKSSKDFNEYLRHETPEADYSLMNFSKILDYHHSQTNKYAIISEWAADKLYEGTTRNQKQLDIVDRYLDDPKRYQEDFNKLPEDVKKLASILEKDYLEMYKIAEEHGMITSWIENYTPHMYKNHPERTSKILQ
jgi:hypothetical protein